MENKKLNIISSTLDDVFKLKDCLRLVDIKELDALQSNPYKALLKGYVYSEECYSVWKGEKVIGMFGVSSYSLPKGFASIWFLGSDDVRQYPITFVKEGKRFVEKQLQKYDILMNYVSSQNTDSIRWLRAIGMIISNKYTVINDCNFLQFYKVRKRRS